MSEIVKKAETAIAAQQNDLTDLMRVALEKDTSVESLERLFALYERDQESKAKRAFNSAMVAFKRDCPAIPKNKTASVKSKKGTSYSYKFAPLDQLTAVVDPVLSENGLSYRLPLKNSERAIQAFCHVRHIDGHEEITEGPVIPVDPELFVNDAQKAGITQQYAMRYALLAALALSPTDSDTDGEDLSKIGPGQCADLEALIEETKANKARFLKVFGVERVDDLSVANFGPAVKMLQAKRK